MSRSDENSQAVRGPAPGALVTYRYQKRYRMGVVVGPVGPEPTTGRPWVGVRVPHRKAVNAFDLIDVSTIIDTRWPPAR